MDDKKKIAVLAALFAVMIAIGAFTFSKGGDSSQTPAKTETGEQQAKKEVKVGETNDGTEEQTQVVAMAPLPGRDPFDGSRYMPKIEAPKPTPPAPTPAPAKLEKPFRPSGLSGSGFAPVGPGVGPLPNAGGSAPISVSPGEKLEHADDFNYTVSGVILGDKPAAVFTDEKGNQRLIPLGGSLDGDSRLTGVERGKVTVRHRGKTKTFTVGGQSN
ncbi:MAG TPA: hypothetical protein VEX38_04520 [Fimbriimonadaceae bacterium]|nr:hypothetical protein [Fimbriimonadaceae bacterium]